MSQKNRQKRHFKARFKQYPSQEHDGITHVYPFPGAKTTKVVEQDRAYFLAHPGERTYMRPYVPGELAGCPVPDGVDLNEVAYVKVFRIGEEMQARIPLTAEQATRSFSAGNKLTGS